MHQILIDTRAALDNLAIEAATAHLSGLGTSMSPPAILAAEEAGSSEVVTAGIAGRILNPRSPDWELKDRCDYSLSLTKKALVGREGSPGLNLRTFVVFIKHLIA